MRAGRATRSAAELRRDPRRRRREPCHRARRDLRDDGPLRLRQVDAPARRQRAQPRDARAGAGRGQRTDRSTSRAAARQTSGASGAQRVAMVFQQFGLLPWRTVAENVGLGLELRGEPPAERQRIVAQQLELVGLARLGALRRQRAVGRHAAARGPRPRVRDERRHPADGRAVLGARSADPRQAAGRAAGAAGAREEDDPVREPRPRRGAAPRRPHLDHAQRAHRADRHGPGHRAAPGGRLRRRVRAPHEPAEGADRRDGHARPRASWSAADGALFLDAGAALPPQARRRRRADRAHARRRGRIRCAPWTTTRPARRTSGRSSSRRPRSRCRDSSTCAGARATPCCLRTAGGCWASRAKRRSSRRCRRAAAQGRLHEARIHGCRPRAHAGRGRWPARPARACRTATFDLQGHRGARGLAPENTLAGFARALAIGVTTLELDCGVTKDGVVVVSHDRLLNPDHTRDADGQFLDDAGPGDRRPHLRGAPPVRRRPHQAGQRVRGGLPGAAAGRRRAHSAPRRRLRAGRTEAATGPCASTSRPRSTRRTPDRRSRRWPSRARSSQAIRDAGMVSRVTVQSFDWRTLRLLGALAPEIALVALTDQQPDEDTIEIGKPGASAWLGELDVDDHGGSVPKLVQALGAKTWSPHARDLTPALVVGGACARPCRRAVDGQRPEGHGARASRSASTASSPTTRTACAPCWNRRASRCRRRRRRDDRLPPAGAARRAAAGSIASIPNTGACAGACSPASSSAMRATTSSATTSRSRSRTCSPSTRSTARRSSARR